MSPPPLAYQSEFWKASSAAATPCTAVPTREVLINVNMWLSPRFSVPISQPLASCTAGEAQDQPPAHRRGGARSATRAQEGRRSGVGAQSEGSHQAGGERDAATQGGHATVREWTGIHTGVVFTPEWSSHRSGLHTGVVFTPEWTGIHTGVGTSNPKEAAIRWQT